MKRIITTIILLSVLAGSTAKAQQQIPWDEAYAKAAEKMKELTLKEKMHFMRGYSSFFFYGVPEKGIPYLYLSDASQGVKMRHNLPDPNMVKQLEKSTAFPSTIMLAATFDADLAYRYAKAVGEECRAGGIEILLGPGMNMYRNSQNGRNFEYVGEDPHLASMIIENYVKGMQSTGTASCLKHFVCNETEFYRRRSNSVVDERALHEIYMAPFKAGIDAGVAYVMASYNQVNGEWAGQSTYVLKDLLRDDLGFRGCVMSDWGSVYDTEKVIKSGLNMEMPGRGQFFSDTKRLMEEGKIREEDIDKMILPSIATAIAFGLYDREKYAPELLEKFPEHNDLVYEVAASGTVLLKNNGILPLAEGRKILLTGKFINEVPRTPDHRSASGAVPGYDNITLLDALNAEFPGQVTYVENPDDEAIQAADVVLLSVGTHDIESFERPFALPDNEEKNARRITKLNPNTIVLVNSGSGIRMTDWNGKAAAVIYGFYPGQCGQKALADILSGDLNPCGKLPMTIEKEFKDSPAYGTMPKGAEFYHLAPRAYNEAMITVYDVNYKESVLMGYRWYEAKGIEPLYPFGFGLSYTTFEISKPKAPKSFDTSKPLKISVELKNTGSKDGAETIQVYVTEKNPTVLRPKKELKSIKKVALKAGEKQKVEFELSKKDFAFWNDQTHEWTVNSGTFVISLGTSSANIAQTLEIEVK